MQKLERIVNNHLLERVYGWKALQTKHLDLIYLTNKRVHN
jgi:hypothetical protein